MTFNSLAFLVFAPTFFLLYWVLGTKARIALILMASYVFYGWWNWRFAGLLLFTTTNDYVLGRLLMRARARPKRHALVAVSIAVNLTVLGIFKYFNFFAGSLTDLMHALGMQADPITLRLILPIGISFYTFQSLSYIIDVYRGDLKAERNFVFFAAFVAMFPQLVAGPIVRASRLLPQLHEGRAFRWVNVLLGLELVAYGYFLKVGVADNLGGVADDMLLYPQAHSAATLLTGILFFTFQIYGDFAGYSLIAIGLGRMMGYDFGRNFRRPYLSAGFREFWTRWHISLSSWLRDYLYIPLGGNRGGRWRTARNLMITMLLGGLWHGASLTFVIWGGLHGFYLVMQRALTPFHAAVMRVLRVPPGVRNIIAVAIVFSLTVFAWIFFRAPTLTDALAVIEGLVVRRDYDFATLAGKFDVVRGIVGIIIIVAVDLFAAQSAMRSWFRRQRLMRQAVVVAIGWYLFFIGNFAGERFIYFQF